MVELEEGEICTTSAERRLAARLKDVAVRVEGSINKSTTTLPRKAGVFFMLLVETSLKDEAVSKMALISSAERYSRPRRCFLVQFNFFLLI